MFQIEIYEYTPKMSDIYHHFFSHIENKNSGNNNSGIENNFSASFANTSNHHIEDTIENKFLKIKSISHHSVCRYFEFIKEDNNYIFISENAGESLDEIIDARMSENVSFKIDEVAKILFQLLIGLNYLEKKSIFLRFLDPKRILLNEENGSVKIKNYLVDIIFKSEELKFLNNFKYLAPELIFYPDNLNTCKSVIWSLGIIALELLLNMRKFSSHQNLFYYYSSNEFLKDYVEILIKYKDTSIFLKSEKNVEYNCSDPRILLEYYLNGHFTFKEELSEDFKDFLCCCLQIDPDKRKESSYLLNHPLFSKNQIIKNQILKETDKSKYYLIPIDNHNQLLDNLRSEIFYKKASSLDNYEIFKNILKIDIITFLKKKGIINYRPKILEIPQYFSLYSPEGEDYSLTAEDDNSVSISSLKTKKQERRKSIELIYENLLNEKKFNEGCLIQIGNYIINLPADYEKDSVTLENFMKNSLTDLNIIKSDLSDKSSSSGKSRYSIKENTSCGNLIRSTSSIKNILNPSIEKDINYYFKIKHICSNILVHHKDYKKEDLIVEIKKMNYHIPSNFRKYVYQILLDIDSVNDIEDFEFSSFYENKNIIFKEMSQIRKDIIRCEEYDSLYKTEEGKYLLLSLFEALLYNNEEFFYTQGMDSIASAIIKLYFPNKELAYQVFNRLIKKLLFIFLDKDNKTIKNLNFHHLIIQRLIAYLDPELYLYLESIAFFEDQFSANWILTLFSRTFKFDFLFKIWDVLLLENINIIYIFICMIFQENKSYIMSNPKENIIRDLNEISVYVKIDTMITEVLRYYKLIPINLFPVSYEFNEEVFSELKKNEYFKNRWWDFENFYTDAYKVPIITVEDTIKFFDRVIFVDIRLQLEYENLRVKDSFHLSLGKGGKYQENCLKNIDQINGNKIVVLVGSKESKYEEYVTFLLHRKIKFVTILHGGIDIIYLDEISLIHKK